MTGTIVMTRSMVGCFLWPSGGFCSPGAAVLKMKTDLAPKENTGPGPGPGPHASARLFWFS